MVRDDMEEIYTWLLFINYQEVLFGGRQFV